MTPLRIGRLRRNGGIFITEQAAGPAGAILRFYPSLIFRDVSQCWVKSSERTRGPGSPRMHAYQKQVNQAERRKRCCLIDTVHVPLTGSLYGGMEHSKAR
jgi:hypothetical protein